MVARGLGLYVKGDETPDRTGAGSKGTDGMDTRVRTLVKSILWTLLGLMVMAIVGYAFTGSVVVGGGMAVVNGVLGFVSYTLYERVWANIGWGRHHV